jgi:hypothetical protein
MLRRLARSLIWVALLACQPPPVRSAPRAVTPVTSAPQAALPADLDVTLRVNVELLTTELGQSVARRLLVDAVTAPGEPSASSLLERALARADLLWLGFRSGGSLDTAEKVLIMRGHFADLSPDPTRADPNWSPSPAGLPHFRNDTTRPGALTRLYPRGEELVVWATEGEAISVEQLLASGSDSSGLRAPERGAVSAAARPERLRMYLDRYPQLAEHFAGVQLLQAYVDPSAAHLELELELRFETSAQALGASDVFEKLRQGVARQPCAVGVVAQMASVSVFERSLRVLASLQPEQVGGVEACVLSGKCCD